MVRLIYQHQIDLFLVKKRTGNTSTFLCDEGDFVIASSGIKVEYFNEKNGVYNKRNAAIYA